MTCYVSLLFIGGLLAGVVRFFIIFLGLPAPKDTTLMFSNSNSFSKNKPNPHPPWKYSKYLALIGYIAVAELGAFLTPMIDKVLGGLPGLKDIKTTCHPWEQLIVLGYGLLFGYYTLRILIKVYTKIQAADGSIIYIEK